MNLRRNPTQSLQNDRLSAYEDEQIDSQSAQHMTNEPSTRSIFQVAYSQKSEKQGPNGGVAPHGRPGASTVGNPNPLQVSVAQTM